MTTRRRRAPAPACPPARHAARWPATISAAARGPRPRGGGRDDAATHHAADGDRARRAGPARARGVLPTAARLARDERGSDLGDAAAARQRARAVLPA